MNPTHPAHTRGVSVPALPPPPEIKTHLATHQTLTFGDYRRPSILERCVLTLAAIGPVGWKAFNVFRKMRQTWSKVLVAVVAPAVAWVVRSIIAYFYRHVFSGRYKHVHIPCIEKALLQSAQG